MSGKQPSPHRPRRSACADASLQREIERVSKMTIEERVIAALTMRDRFAWLHADADKRITEGK